MQDHRDFRDRKNHSVSSLVGNRRRRLQAGASWIELLIAILLLALMLTAALPGLIQAGLSFQHSESRTLATLAALSQCEFLLCQANSELASGQDQWSVERGAGIPPLVFDRTWAVSDAHGGWNVEVRVSVPQTPSSRETVLRLFRGK
jgi:Tfp pilus assembly protein PilV